MRENYPTVDEEALEATDTMLNERLELGGISRDDTPIEADIDPAFTLGSLDLLLEASDGGSGRDGIQGHIHDGGDTTKGRSLGSSIETLPFCPARLIEMDMGIDQTREENMRGIVGV